MAGPVKTFKNCRQTVKPSNPPIPISFLAHPSGITQLCRIDIDGFVLRLQKGSRLVNANVGILRNSKVQDRRDLWCLPIVQVLIAGPMKSIVNVYHSMSFYVIISGFKCHVNSYIYIHTYVYMYVYVRYIYYILNIIFTSRHPLSTWISAAFNFTRTYRSSWPKR